MKIISIKAPHSWEACLTEATDGGGYFDLSIKKHDSNWWKVICRMGRMFEDVEVEYKKGLIERAEKRVVEYLSFRSISE